MTTHPSGRERLAGAGTGAANPATRGLTRPMHPQVLGAVIGAAGGSAFVLVNAGTLGRPWSQAAVLVWAVCLVTTAWVVLARPRRLADPGPPRPHAGAVYAASVLGMLAAFILGRLVLEGVGRPELLPAVVVVAVGLHFWPFAAAFRAPVFAGLCWSLVAIGVVGVALGLVAGAVAVAAATVAAGVALLVWIAVDAARDGAPA